MHGNMPVYSSTPVLCTPPVLCTSPLYLFWSLETHEYWGYWALSDEIGSDIAEAKGGSDVVLVGGRKRNTFISYDRHLAYTCPDYGSWQVVESNEGVRSPKTDAYTVL